MYSRRRANSGASSSVSAIKTSREQELNSMYDFLAKVILLGPSGCGKSCVLHRFVRDEWRVLSSQTIGVEFASRIVKVGTGARKRRIKLQLWDIAGTERFRSVSRSYYRGAAAAILVYDITSHPSFAVLPTFLCDVRALASPHVLVVLAGNKADIAEPPDFAEPVASSASSVNSRRSTGFGQPLIGSMSSSAARGLGIQSTKTTSMDGREVSTEEATAWATQQGIKVAVEVSALTGENIEEIFLRLARTILTQIELGEINPDDPLSGIQYGDSRPWESTDDGGSVRSNTTIDGPYGDTQKRRRRRGTTSLTGGMRDWEEVFCLGPSSRSLRRCC